MVWSASRIGAKLVDDGDGDGRPETLAKDDDAIWRNARGMQCPVSHSKRVGDQPLLGWVAAGEAVAPIFKGQDVCVDRVGTV